MALVICKECAREVWDKARHCPGCGAPIGVPARDRQKLRRIVYATSIVLLLFWFGVTLLWLTGRISRPSELLNPFRTPRPVASATVMSPITIEPLPVAHDTPVESRGKATSRSIYQTTAEQLNDDYSANEVATQNKIGERRIGISGSVAEISEDTQGRAVVTLWAGADGKADLLLLDDQTAAAAQLTKGDSVDIECERMRRVASRPYGSDCVLAVVDASAKQVYLAVFMVNGSADAPAYIIGPMPQSTCVGHADRIAAQLTGGSKGDHVASTNCASTARESIPVEGCHLNSTMSAVPDVPAAHLWKYDCLARNVTAHKSDAKKSSQKPLPVADIEPNVEAAPVGAIDAPPHPPAASSPAPVTAAVTSPSPTPAPAPATPAAAAGIGVALAVPIASAATAGATTSAAAPAPSASTTATTQQMTTTDPTASLAPALPDDLLPVRAKDPGAAEHIASYCDSATASASNHASFAAGCRQSEISAWTRLVVNNEFPGLDDATRRKCSEPPFPDSYVAKESCAKYQLHKE
jgi:hypothetical protein